MGIVPPSSTFSDGALASWTAVYSGTCDVGTPTFDCDPSLYYFKVSDSSFNVQSNNLLVFPCGLNDEDCDGICNTCIDGVGSDYCVCFELNDGSFGDPCANTSLGEDTDESGCSLEQAGCLGSGWNCNSVPWSECDESTNTRFRTLTALKQGCTCNPIDDNPCCSWDEVKNLLPTKASCIKEKPFPVFSTINMAIAIALLGMYYFLRKEHANS